MGHSNNLLACLYLHQGETLLGNKSGVGNGDGFQKRTVHAVLFHRQECGLVQILTLNDN